MRSLRPVAAHGTSIHPLPAGTFVAQSVPSTLTENPFSRLEQQSPRLSTRRLVTSTGAPPGSSTSHHAVPLRCLRVWVQVPPDQLGFGLVVFTGRSLGARLLVLDWLVAARERSRGVLQRA